mgnify:CR=1 FL=1
MKIAKLAAIAALIAVSTSASAWWGGGPWGYGGYPYYGGWGYGGHPYYAGGYWPNWGGWGYAPYAAAPAQTSSKTNKSKS